MVLQCVAILDNQRIRMECSSGDGLNFAVEGGEVYTSQVGDRRCCDLVLSEVDLQARELRKSRSE